MNFKAQLKNLESKAPQGEKITCIYIIGVYPTGQTKPPVIGYGCEAGRYMRLENENDDDLHERVNAGVTEYLARPECNKSALMIQEILKNDTVSNDTKKTN